MKLPGELRNRIYELVLGQDQKIAIRDRRTRYHHKNEPGLRQKNIRWREPGILSVSKQIRAECIRLYYDGNRFEIYAGSDELAEVLKFLSRKSAGEAVTLSFSIRVLDAKWGDIPDWLQLAKIVYCMDTQKSHVVDIRPYDDSLSTIACTLQHISKLSIKARDRGLLWEDLKSDFVDWAKAALAMQNTLNFYTRKLILGRLLRIAEEDVL